MATVLIDVSRTNQILIDQDCIAKTFIKCILQKVMKITDSALMRITGVASVEDQISIHQEFVFILCNLLEIKFTFETYNDFIMVVASFFYPLCGVQGLFKVLH